MQQIVRENFEHSRKIRSTVQELLEKVNTLKREVEEMVVLDLPFNSLDLEKTSEMEGS